MQQVRIDFDNPGLPQSLGVVEGESQSRLFQAALYKSGAAYTAPAGAVYSIMYRGFGPQNQGWYDTIEDGAGKRAACTVSGNVVTCELARQALRVPGHLTVVLCVSDAKGYMLKSWPIMADARNDGYEDTGEIEMYFNLSGLAGNYLTQLEKAMADAEKIKNNLTSTSAQVQKDIDAKAAAALKSIPEEYTELDGSVKQLKEDIVVNSKINTADGYSLKKEQMVIGIWEGKKLLSNKTWWITNPIPIFIKRGDVVSIKTNKLRCNFGIYIDRSTAKQQLTDIEQNTNMTFASLYDGYAVFAFQKDYMIDIQTNEYDAEVNIERCETEPIEIKLLKNKYVRYQDGKILDYVDWYATEYFDVSDYGIVEFPRMISRSSNPSSGAAFYGVGLQYISGVQAKPGTSNNEHGIENYVVIVPPDAKYMSFTMIKGFELYAHANGYIDKKRKEKNAAYASYMRKIENLSRDNSLINNGDYYNQTSCKKDATFLIMSDVHGSEEAVNRWIGIGNYYKNLIDGLIYLGDTQSKKIQNDYTFYTSHIQDSESPIYACLGNHDIGDPWNSSTKSGGSINLETAYSRYIAPLVDKGWIETEKCFWYKDLEKYRIRIISLNMYDANKASTTDEEEWMYSCYFSTEQLQWLADTLYSTPDKYTVLLIGHQFPSAKENVEFVSCNFTVSKKYDNGHWGERVILEGTPIEDIVNAFKTKTVISKTYKSKNSNLPDASVSKDFSTAKSNLYSCMLYGHTHSTNITESALYRDQVFINAPSSSVNVYQRKTDDIRPVYTEDDNFLCIAIDTENKLIKIIKLGCTVTNDMVAREQIAVPYN